MKNHVKTRNSSNKSNTKLSLKMSPTTTTTTTTTTTPEFSLNDFSPAVSGSRFARY